jgi:hypothetical protein
VVLEAAKHGGNLPRYFAAVLERGYAMADRLLGVRHEALYDRADAVVLRMLSRRKRLHVLANCAHIPSLRVAARRRRCVADRRRLGCIYRAEVQVVGQSDVPQVSGSRGAAVTLRPSEALAGPEGQTRIADDFALPSPDLRVRVDLLLAEGDYVVGR